MSTINKIKEQFTYDINSIETSQVKIVNDRIINKIFNDIVANW